MSQTDSRGRVIGSVVELAGAGFLAHLYLGGVTSDQDFYLLQAVSPSGIWGKIQHIACEVSL